METERGPKITEHENDNLPPSVTVTARPLCVPFHPWRDGGFHWMIVEPDFLDHWKTRMLVRLLNDERAPLYVIRLWAHCQQRKTDRFTGWNPTVLASVCRWDGDGLTLWKAMGSTFLEIDGENVVAHGWLESNRGLVSAWTNGRLGGRPSASKPTQAEPTGNRPVNQPETDRVTDRVDRVDKTKNTPPASPSGSLFPETESPKPKAKRELPPGFEAFWSAYPKRVSKPQAERAWAKLHPDDATQRRILAHVQAQRATDQWTKDNGAFIPYPASYLNARRWEDFIEPLAPSRPKRLSEMTEAEKKEMLRHVMS